MKHMSNFTINSHERLKEKLDLISNLLDIKVTHKIMNPKVPKQKVNPMDEHYDKLNCKI